VGDSEHLGSARGGVVEDALSDTRLLWPPKERKGRGSVAPLFQRLRAYCHESAVTFLPVRVLGELQRLRHVTPQQLQNFLDDSLPGGQCIPDAGGRIIRGGDDALPLGSNAAALIPAPCCSGLPIGSPVRASQMRAVVSSEAVTTRSPLGVEHRGPDTGAVLQRLADRLAGARIPNAGREDADAARELKQSAARHCHIPRPTKSHYGRDPCSNS
jgi:hypothetical protein